MYQQHPAAHDERVEVFQHELGDQFHFEIKILKGKEKKQHLTTSKQTIVLFIPSFVTFSGR